MENPFYPVFPVKNIPAILSKTDLAILVDLGFWMGIPEVLSHLFLVTNYF